ncbi:MAG TPA: hypothetical protein VHQ24_07220 [Lachnospiraceae bacterium]|nr:hypothetical protein [Lachnospiraceae bacterium]
MGKEGTTSTENRIYHEKEQAEIGASNDTNAGFIDTSLAQL